MSNLYIESRLQAIKEIANFLERPAQNGASFN